MTAKEWEGLVALLTFLIAGLAVVPLDRMRYRRDQAHRRRPWER